MSVVQEGAGGGAEAGGVSVYGLGREKLSRVALLLLGERALRSAGEAWTIHLRPRSWEEWASVMVDLLAAPKSCTWAALVDNGPSVTVSTTAEGVSGEDVVVFAPMWLGLLPVEFVGLAEEVMRRCVQHTGGRRSWWEQGVEPSEVVA